MLSYSSNGNLAGVRTLILEEKKGIVNTISEIDGQTPLMKAAIKGHTAIAKLLLENRANVNHQDNLNQTALMFACLHGFGPMIELLVEHGAKTDHQDTLGDTALTWASYNGDSAVILQHIKKGQDNYEKSLKAFTKGAVTGAFKNELYGDVSGLTGSFLFWKDGLQLAQSCKLATSLAEDAKKQVLQKK